jgi:hypothetical protein
MPADDDRSRDPRAVILARRAKYVAMALAGAGIAACSSSQVCLSVTQQQDAGADAADAGEDADSIPQPCLSPPIDTGTPSDDGLDTADAADTTPQPCLSPPFDGGAG